MATIFRSSQPIDAGFAQPQRSSRAAGVAQGIMALLAILGLMAVTVFALMFYVISTINDPVVLTIFILTEVMTFAAGAIGTSVFMAYTQRLSQSSLTADMRDMANNQAASHNQTAGALVDVTKIVSAMAGAVMQSQANMNAMMQTGQWQIQAPQLAGQRPPEPFGLPSAGQSSGTDTKAPWVGAYNREEMQRNRSMVRVEHDGRVIDYPADLLEHFILNQWPISRDANWKRDKGHYTPTAMILCSLEMLEPKGKTYRWLVDTREDAIEFWENATGRQITAK